MEKGETNNNGNNNGRKLTNGSEQSTNNNITKDKAPDVKGSEEKKKQKKMKKYKIDTEFPSVFRDLEKRMQLFEHLPLKKVRKVKKNSKVLDLSFGPYDVQYPNEAFEPFICGKSVSTYPHLPGKPQRDGDPICDSFRVELLEDNVIIAVVCDGCNWGKRPMEASNKAKDALCDYLKMHLHEISDIRDAGHFLLAALSYCHFKICEGKEDVWEAGTTTLIGGVLIHLKDEEKWAWVTVSIGDCKCFHYSKAQDFMIDITVGNRKNVFDARDPGGRLGPYVGEGEPDLRNVGVFYRLVDDDDYILILSDGVHDNLDPQTLGIPPASVSPKYNNIKEWTDFKTNLEVEEAKAEYMKKFMTKDLIFGGDEDKKLRMKVFSFNQTDNDDLSPSNITQRIIKHCLGVTASGREWMEQNPKDKLPLDYAAYPGKMDHATCVVLKAGKFEQAYQKYIQNNKVKRVSKAN